MYRVLKWMVNADTEIEMKWILLNVSGKIFSEKVYGNKSIFPRLVSNADYISRTFLQIFIDNR